MRDIPDNRISRPRRDPSFHRLRFPPPSSTARPAQGTTLILRLAAAGAPNAAVYLDLATNATLAWAGYMQSKTTGLYAHGYDHATRQVSCCAWGRANGWVAAHFVELLAALPKAHAHYDEVLALFRSHADALVATQSADGRWHQVRALRRYSERRWL